MKPLIPSQNLVPKEQLKPNPEYDISEQVAVKRRKLDEDKIKEETKKKIDEILKFHFQKEVTHKDAELDKIDAMLTETRCILDRLRACIVTKYYASPELILNKDNISCVHPATKKHLWKIAQEKTLENSSMDDNDEYHYKNYNANEQKGSHMSLTNGEVTNSDTNKEHKGTDKNTGPASNASGSRKNYIYVKSNLQIVVGNVSKFIPVSQRGDNPELSHIWKAYVRESKDSPKLSDLVKKVCFLLHHSFAPDDFVEVRSPPFEITQRSWGDFPLRVQVHFKDPMNKPVNILHRVKLDRTCTGLTTLNSETHADIRIMVKEEILPKPAPKVPQYETDLMSCEQDFIYLDTGRKSSAVKINNFELPTATNGTENSVDCCGGSDDGDKSTVGEIPFYYGSDPSPKSSIMSSELSSPQSTQNTLMSLTESIQASQSESSSNTSSCHSASSSSLVKSSVYELLTKCKNSSDKVPNNTTIVQAQTVNFPTVSGNFVPKFQKPGSSLFSMLTKEQKVQSPASFKQKPLYVLKLFSSQNDKNQVLLISPTEKDNSKQDPKTVSRLNGFSVPISSPDSLLTILNNSESKVEPKRKLQISSWKQLVEDIDISECRCLETLLKKIVRIFPLVKKDVDRSIFPFCASSIEEYYSWNIAKRRAAEWQRAVMLQSAALHLIQNRKTAYLKPSDLWSKKQLMTWCQKFGHTPEDPCHSGGVVEEIASSSCQVAVNELPDRVHEKSFSDVYGMISSLRENTLQNEDNDRTAVNVLEEEEASSSNTEIIKSPRGHSMVCMPYSSDAAIFVKQTAAKIKVRLKPIECEYGVLVPVIEDMVLKACKLFAEDLMRTALSKSYDRVGSKTHITPEVTLIDVYLAVKDSSEFQFLTNKHMAVTKSQTDDC